MRSFTWVGVAQSIAVFLALARRRNDRQRDRHELADPAARQWADGALARSQRGARGPAGRQCLAVGVPIAGRRIRSADEALHAAFRCDRPIGFRAWHICDRDRNQYRPMAAAEGGRDSERLRGAQSARMGHRVFWPRDTDDFIRRRFHAGLRSRYGDERTARAIAEVALRCSDGPPRRVRSIGGAIWDSTD